MRRAGLGLALAVALSAGCQRTEAPLDTLILGTLADPSSLDPAFVGQSGAREVLGLMFRDLTVLDDEWQVRPELAASLPITETSSAGFLAVWQLRPGLKWSDGAPLTSEDLRFGWSIERDPKLEAVSHATATRVRAMRAPSARTLEVRWGEAFADHAAPRVHAVLPRHAYPRPRPGRPFVGMQDDPVGSGPYRLVARSPGEHLTFERNPHWWGPRPALAKIIFRIFPSEDGFEPALATGAIHGLGEAAGITPDRVAALRERLADSHEVVVRDGGVLLHLDVRHDHPALGRVEVRRQLSAAIDREGLAAVTYDGLARPARGLFPPRHPGFLTEGATQSAARTDISGLPEDQRRLTLGIGAGSGAASRAGAFVQAALEDAGWSVELQVQPMGTLFERMRAHTQPDLVLYAWRVRPDWDGASVLETGGRQNYGQYSDPTLDRRFAALRGELDLQRRAAALREVEAVVRRRLPMIPLLFRKTVSVRPKQLAGWRPTGTVTPVTWSAEGWRWVR